MDVRWTPTDPEPDYLKPITEFFLGVDLEFSIGYSF